MNIKSFCRCLFVSITLASFNANAAIIYDEAVSGDLGGLLEQHIILYAVDGVNEIKGSNWSAETSANSGSINVTEDKRDAFYLNVTSTMTITDFDILFSNPVFHTDINDDDGFGWGVAYIKPNTVGGRVSVSRNILTNGDYNIPSINTINQTVDQYEIHHNLLGASAAGVCTPDCTWDYTIRITIDDSAPPQVPVPAALWLFGSGLIGLTGMARRKLHNDSN